MSWVLQLVKKFEVTGDGAEVSDWLCSFDTREQVLDGFYTAEWQPNEERWMMFQLCSRQRLMDTFPQVKTKGTDGSPWRIPPQAVTPTKTPSLGYFISHITPAVSWLLGTGTQSVSSVFLNLCSAACQAVSASVPFPVFRHQSGSGLPPRSRSPAALPSSVPLFDECVLELAEGGKASRACARMCLSPAVVGAARVTGSRVSHCALPRVVFDSNASKPLPVVSSNGF